MENFKSKTTELKTEWVRQASKCAQSIDVESIHQLDTEMNDTVDNVGDINLTNQLIGEVQGFIFVMRWLIYEFYGFKGLKQEGLLSAADFDALEDDMLYIIHKVTCVNQVYETLLVLSRLLNN